jgi:phosphoribosyl 1,2-cyclic phosphodiesterase
MYIYPLASSSSGNCTYIRTENAHVLIDAGVALKEIIAATGRKEFDALFITHDHSDHIKSAGPACPVYINPLIYKKKSRLFNSCTIEDLNPAQTVTIKDLELTTFSTKHDALYTYGFSIKDLNNNKKLCYLTDTGTITPLMVKFMQGADAYLIETDYDIQKLREYEEYDEYLKERIASAFGHLSNKDAMDGLKAIGIDHAEFIIFAHLSPRTNTPDLVMDLAKLYFPDYPGEFYIAPLTEEIEL